MIKGFKDFLMRGNVVDLAVAVIIGGAFATVVKSFVTVLMDIIGKAFQTESFSSWVPAGIHLGDFLTAVVSFVLVAAAVYFVVVVPLAKLAERRARGEQPAPEEPTAEVALLTEIRDALRAR